MPDLSILQYKDDQQYKGDSIFSRDGGETWFSSGTYHYVSPGTTFTLLVRDVVQTLTDGTFFWDWRDGTKTFSRKITMPDTDLTIIANVNTYPKPVNKVVFGDDLTDPRTRVLLDLSSDTVDADHLAQTYIAHNNKGEVIKGNLENVDGNTLYWQDAWDPSLPLGGPIYVPSDGAFTVDLNSTNHTAENIKNGVQLLGKTGTYTSDATLNNDNLLPEGVVGYGNATKYTGTATTHSSTATTPITDISLKTIVQGPSYISNGVSLNAQVSDTNLTTSNIKGGVTILGVPGDPLVADVGDSDIVNSSYILKGKIYYGLDDDATSAAKVTGTLELPEEYSVGGSLCDNTAIEFHMSPDTTSIRQQMFQSLSKLVSVEGPFQNITNIGYAAFENCSSLRGSFEFDKSQLDNSNIFKDSGIQSISFLSATTIPAYTCQNCTELISANFPEATTIFASAFSGCTSLTSAYFPKATVLWQAAFYNCTSLIDIDLSSVTDLWLAGTATTTSVTFYNCSSLQSLDLSNVTSLKSKTSFNQYAFDGCTNLLNINLSNLNTSTGYCFIADSFNSLPQNCVITFKIPYYIQMGSSGASTFYSDGSISYQAMRSGSTTAYIYKNHDTTETIATLTKGGSATKLQTSTGFIYVKYINSSLMLYVSDTEEMLDLNEDTYTEEEQTESDYSSMTQEELIAIINQQNQRIEELENSGTEEE